MRVNSPDTRVFVTSTPLSQGQLVTSDQYKSVTVSMDAYGGVSYEYGDAIQPEEPPRRILTIAPRPWTLRLVKGEGGAPKLYLTLAEGEEVALEGDVLDQFAGDMARLLSALEMLKET